MTIEMTVIFKSGERFTTFTKNVTNEQFIELKNESAKCMKAKNQIIVINNFTIRCDDISAMLFLEK